MSPERYGHVGPTWQCLGRHLVMICDFGNNLSILGDGLSTMRARDELIGPNNR